MSRIIQIKAKEILDSRKNPTVFVSLKTEDGIFKAAVPSGASRGEYEALELRDGGKRKKGLGVLKAVENINKIIAPKLIGKNPEKQEEIDFLMLDLDGTTNKSKLGANAILAVSIAVSRAGAKAKGIPLWKHINGIFGKISKGNYQPSLPRPCFNIINGGEHADSGLDIQEFMVVPKYESFKENLKVGKEVYGKLEDILKKQFGKKGIKKGDEAGFAPPIMKAEEAIELIIQAGRDFNFGIGLDCAASYSGEDPSLRIDYYKKLAKDYYLLFLEDPFSQEDWGNWKRINEKLDEAGLKTLIIGDDLTVTNKERTRKAFEEKCIDGIIVKPNQIGSVMETLATVFEVKKDNLKIIVSHRSGETEDDFVADLAVGIGADYIKSGAPSTKFRMAKYNRLLEIEKQLK